MKHYDLDKIEPVLIRCNQYVSAMIGFYKMQGIKIPREVRELDKDLFEIISKIERKTK